MFGRQFTAQQRAGLRRGLGLFDGHLNLCGRCGVDEGGWAAAVVWLCGLVLRIASWVSERQWASTRAATTTTMGLAPAGYAIRLDAEACCNAQRLLSQQRAARKAEAESAALTERGRNAREFHVVLARSLSVRLVHLIQRSASLKADRANFWSGCRCAGG